MRFFLPCFRRISAPLVLLVRAIAGLLPACSIVGCSDPSGPTDEAPLQVEAEHCVADGEELPADATRPVIVGLGEGDDFQALQEGQEVALVLGGQGGYMIVPSLRVPVLEGDGNEACWNVHLDNELDGTPVSEVPDLLSRVKFERRGEHLQVDGLYDLLGFESEPLSGRTLKLTVEVTGPDFSGESSVSVVLR